MTQGKEYAELEWPIDLAIAVVWVVFAINFFYTLARRNEKHLYVAIWFYIATIVTVAVLHIVNSLSIPVFGLTSLKSYSIYGGAKDALVQWWYGHNAVAFFLTTPVLGIMYYFVPKSVDRPVYSYRLSIVHFWALVFMYIWAGPHHLLNTALPDWAQTLGMIFSLMLWAPSWGGMINGLLTLRGAWDKLRTDPVVKFFAAGVTFYGMATFEGPLLSIKSVSSVAHYTDWIIAHAHGGALGWNGFMAAGMLYWLFPRLWGKELHSKKLAEGHFWLGTFGILLYLGSMWASGITQGMMLRQLNPDGSLVYATFVETLLAIKPLYWLRLIGGTAYLTGFIMMAYNLARTAMSGKTKETTITVTRVAPEPGPSFGSILLGKPVLVAVIGFALLTLGALLREPSSSFTVILFGAFVAVFMGIALALTSGKDGKPTWHRLIEGRALVFTILALVAVLIGGMAELIPSILVRPPVDANVTPYKPLELEGRDIYIREGCYTCHSQMIRPMRFESVRFGDPSTIAESQYDHPFQWGSKRTGPDLARVGGKYPDTWHYKHLVDPRAISPGSNMPSYAHTEHAAIDFTHTQDKLRAMRGVGVPYTDKDIEDAEGDARTHAHTIAAGLDNEGLLVDESSEMVALIAYLQRLGRVPQKPSSPAISER